MLNRSTSRSRSSFIKLLMKFLQVKIRCELADMTFVLKIGNVSAVEFVIVIRFQTAFYFRTVFLVFLFSLYLSEVRVPLPTFSFSKKFHITRYPLFKLLPVSHFYEMHAFYFHLVLLHYVLMCYPKAYN